MSKRALVLVTHLLGAGHLTRAMALACAFSRAGHAVTVVSGGLPTSIDVPENVTLVQLPPVRIHGTAFSRLLDDRGEPASAAYLAARLRDAVTAVRDARPDILITELFPFGRRVLADEFLAVLRQAHALRPRPLVLSSIRDILVAPTTPQKISDATGRVEEFYDAVVVHGDPAVAPLDLSWPVDERLRPFLRYTGYVDEAPDSIEKKPRAGIVVSGGSSPASLPLYHAALDAAALVPGRAWHVLVGRKVDEKAFGALVQNAPPNAKIERARGDFRLLLASAELSISQAGYNTCVDLLRSRVRALLVPFTDDGETEQRTRADCLERRGLAHVFRKDEPDGRSLAETVAAMLEQPLPPPSTIAMNGADETVRIVGEMALASPAFRAAPVDWSVLDGALDEARARGHEPVMWWRDDDAVTDTPQLDRLLRLAARFDAGIALAIVPAYAKPALAERLRAESRVSVLVHGYSHADHAPAGRKRAEFGEGRDIAGMEAEARCGLQNLRGLFADKALPVFVPPWNRVASTLLPRLPGVGYRGLSTFGDRAAIQPVAGLIQINTHLDPIDWHGSRALGDVPALVARMAGAVRARGTVSCAEPLGLLTHHLAHDEAIWRFCEELLEFLAQKNLHFRLVRKLFCDKIGNVVEQ